MEPTPPDTAGTAKIVTMLPADQVTAIVEQLRTEQARLLREQQAVIVEKVLRKLNENGTTSVPKQKVKRGGSRQPSPSKLEESLRSLVFHSLKESGLDYPHVQSDRHVGSLHTNRPDPSTRSHREGKATVVSRPELIVRHDRFVDEAQATSTQRSEGSHVSQPRRAKCASAKVSKLSPGDSMFMRDSRQTQIGTRRRRHKEPADCDERVARNDDFDSVRSKVGLKTLAILDRSRALLDDMKALKSNCRQRADSVGNNSTFAERMRQKLAPPEPPRLQIESIADDTPHEITDETEPARPLHTNHGPTTNSTNDETHVLITKAQSDQPNGQDAACTEHEILRPPVHSPENEDEWENELARQILTIYATSIKAKRTSTRPSSQSKNRGCTSPSTAGRQRTRQSPGLGSSCSLPALVHTNKPSALDADKQDRCRSRSPPRAAVHYSWEPSQRLDDGRVVINMPKVPKPIWFAGTGAVKAVWCAIAEGFQGLHASLSKAKSGPRGHGVGSDATAVCEHQLCEEVRRLEAKQQYSQCVTTLETLLISLVRARGVDRLEIKLWKQLVVTCNAFASRCVDYKKFSVALQLIKQAEHLIHNSILVDDTMRLELLAYLYDTYAHYYYRRGKSHAGLQYMFKAHEIHGRQSSWAHIAKCRLHIANLLSSQSKHQDAMGYMAGILELIEDKKLEDAGSENGASAQKVCLAAVCYNNIAIEQLHLRQFEAASVSTGNAKRLAKLCLSYSNRWLAQFDATSNCVDLAIATLMEDENAAANAAYKC